MSSMVCLKHVGAILTAIAVEPARGDFRSRRAVVGDCGRFPGSRHARPGTALLQERWGSAAAHPRSPRSCSEERPTRTRTGETAGWMVLSPPSAPVPQFAPGPSSLGGQQR
jgi:hypothetical protein